MKWQYLRMQQLLQLSQALHLNDSAFHLRQLARIIDTPLPQFSVCLSFCIYNQLFFRYIDLIRLLKTLKTPIL